MNNRERFIIYPTLVICVIFSIFFLCNKFPRIICEEGIYLDYIGIIIGILALLVTVLMGWNIYTVIDTKKVLNDAEKRYEDFQGKTENDIQEIRRKTDEELKNIQSESEKLKEESQRSIEDITKERDFNSVWMEGEIRFQLGQNLSACECYLIALMKDIPQTDKNNVARDEIEHRIGLIGRRLRSMQKIKKSEDPNFTYACDFDPNELDRTIEEYYNKEHDNNLKTIILGIKQYRDLISYREIDRHAFRIFRQWTNINKRDYDIYVLLDRDYNPINNKYYDKHEDFSNDLRETWEAYYEYIGVCSCKNLDDQHRVFEELKKVGSGSVELAADSNK